MAGCTLDFTYQLESKRLSLKSLLIRIIFTKWSEFPYFTGSLLLPDTIARISRPQLASVLFSLKLNSQFAYISMSFYLNEIYAWKADGKAVLKSTNSTQLQAIQCYYRSTSLFDLYQVEQIYRGYLTQQ